MGKTNKKNPLTYFREQAEKRAKSMGNKPMLPKHQTSPGETITPFRKLFMEHSGYKGTDTIPAGMPNSTYDPNGSDYRLREAHKETYGNKDNTNITTPAQEKAVRDSVSNAKAAAAKAAKFLEEYKKNYGENSPYRYTGVAGYYKNKKGGSIKSKKKK